jgi:hypothetical protein
MCFLFLSSTVNCFTNFKITQFTVSFTFLLPCETTAAGVTCCLAIIWLRESIYAVSNSIIFLDWFSFTEENVLPNPTGSQPDWDLGSQRKQERPRLCMTQGSSAIDSGSSYKTRVLHPHGNLECQLFDLKLSILFATLRRSPVSIRKCGAM